jgi:hypothetical protein
MISPAPYQLKCPNCGHIKIVKPESDVLNPMDFMSTCPKYKAKMDREEINTIDTIFDAILK